MSKIYDYVINNEVNKNVLKSVIEADGSEGGGGGSSDFSTAEVTIDASEDANQMGMSFIAIPQLANDGLVCYEDATTGDPMRYAITLSVCLYKGVAYAYYPNPFNLQIILTGDIVDNGDGYLTINGNGTIRLEEPRD